MRNDVKIYTNQQGTDEWLQDRSKHFTASTANELMMKSTNKGFQDLISRIAIERIVEKSIENGFQSASMERGLELEAEARQALEEIQFCKIKEYGFIELDEWIGASIDGEIDKDQIIEIKCHEFKAHSRLLLGIEEIENRYILQMQFSMWVTGTKSCIYFGYYPGIKPFESLIMRDEEMIKAFQERIEFAKQEVIKRMELFKI